MANTSTFSYKKAVAKATKANFLKWFRLALASCPNGNNCDLYINLLTGNVTTLYGNLHYRVEEELHILSVNIWLGERAPSAVWLLEEKGDYLIEEYLKKVEEFFRPEIEVCGDNVESYENEIEKVKEYIYVDRNENNIIRIEVQDTNGEMCIWLYDSYECVGLATFKGRKRKLEVSLY